MLASFGAGCAAAFLQKRAGASAHVRSATGYAFMNWGQSMLTWTGVKAPVCHYGCLPTESGVFPGLSGGLMLGLLWTLTMVWMHILVACRLELLERTSNQRYRAGCLRKLVWAQAFGAMAVILPCLSASVLLGLSPLESEGTLSPLESEGTGDADTIFWWCLSLLAVVFFAGLVSMLCSVVASMVAIWSLTKCFLQLRTVSCLAEREDTPVAVGSSLKRARRFAILQLMGVSASILFTILLIQVAVWASLHLSYASIDGDAAAEASALMDAMTFPFSVIALLTTCDYLSNAAAALLLSGSHRLLTKEGQPRQAKQPISCRRCTLKPKAMLARELEWSPLWKEKVEELSARGMTLRSLMCFYQEDLCSVPDWRYVPKDHKTRDVVRRAIIPITRAEECAYAVSTQNRDGAQKPAVMVTHNWGNCFKDLACGFQVFLSFK